MIDVGFIVTLAIIFIAALLGSYVRGRAKDRCLKDFDGYHVTVEKKNGHIIWGTMHLQPTGMELEYGANVEDVAHIETSYLLYKSEYKDLQAIYRYADELTPEARRRRERSLRKSFHPGPSRILARKLRNFISTATDSLSEAITVITGQAKKPAGGRFISDTGQASLNRLGKELIGYVGTNFDPLLEEYVGAKVVVEVAEGDEIFEYVGILKDYSADFLEVLDVFYPQVLSINLKAQESLQSLARDIRITADGVFRIRNASALPLLLYKIKCGDREEEISAVIGPGDEISLQELTLGERRTDSEGDLAVFFEGLSKKEEDARQARRDTAESKLNAELLEGILRDTAETQDVEFDFKVIRLLDMILPRAHALVRHKAERYDPNAVLGEIGLARRFRRTERLKEESAYREALAKNPYDMTSCLALSRLLVQQGKYEEALPLLERALQHRELLLDRGRLAELQLQMVRRKLAKVQTRPR